MAVHSRKTTLFIVNLIRRIEFLMQIITTHQFPVQVIRRPIKRFSLGVLRMGLHRRVLNLLEACSIGHREISSMAVAINGGIIFVSFDGVTELVFEGQIIIIAGKAILNNLFGVEMPYELLVDLILILHRSLVKISYFVCRLDRSYSMLGRHLRSLNIRLILIPVTSGTHQIFLLLVIINNILRNDLLLLYFLVQ